MAEEEGFEPPFPGGKAVFKTAAISHSATPPQRIGGDNILAGWRPGNRAALFSRAMAKKFTTVFLGSPDFAVPSLKAMCAGGIAPALVVTQPSARRSRRGEPEPTPVGRAAIELGLPLLETESASTGEAFDQIAAIEPDACVVVAFGQILRRSLLKLAPLGCLNVHPSMLPKYRGAAPINWAMMDGVSDSGVTVMRLVKRLDAGPVLAQAPFQIGPEETAPEALARAAVAGAELLSDVLARCAAGNPPVPQEQDEALATYAGLLTPEHGEVDFDKPARRVWDQIRAVQPWPRANTTVHRPGGESPVRLVVWRARVLEEAGDAGVATGTVVGVCAEGPVVACGAGKLVLTELQLEGRRRSPGADFLRGFGMPVGTRLGG